MSVVVWDGTTLAADRQCTSAGSRRTATKIWKHEHNLIGGVGVLTSLHAMVNWVSGGMDPKQFPAIKDDDQLTMFVIPKVGLPVRFENSQFPIPIEDKWFAAGTGCDYAYGAMEMGADSKRAVQVACVYDIYCGQGVDTLTFES